MLVLILGLLLIAFCEGLISFVICNKKLRSNYIGFFLGFFLGIPGIIICAFLKDYSIYIHEVGVTQEGSIYKKDNQIIPSHHVEDLIIDYLNSQKIINK